MLTNWLSVLTDWLLRHAWQETSKSSGTNHELESQTRCWMKPPVTERKTSGQRRYNDATGEFGAGSAPPPPRQGRPPNRTTALNARLIKHTATALRLSPLGALKCKTCPRFSAYAAPDSPFRVILVTAAEFFSSPRLFDVPGRAFYGVARRAADGGRRAADGGSGPMARECGLAAALTVAAATVT